MQTNITDKDYITHGDAKIAVLQHNAQYQLLATIYRTEIRLLAVAEIQQNITK